MSFSSESRARSSPALPLAAMVDINFLLIIFFMTTSALREQETALEVNLQRAQTGRSAASSVATSITLSAKGQIYLAGVEYTPTTLRAKLLEIARAFPDQPIVIRGDRDSSLGLTVEVLDLCRSVGLTNVGLAARKRAEDL